MSPLPDRRTLESMRRADLQKLCKDRGLRANMKTDALIDMLIETTRPASTSQIPQRISSARTVSRASSTRGRVGSMIIHDIPEGTEAEYDDDEPPIPNGTAPPPSGIPGPATRTRKAKEVQSKLGLGRPRALGGQGPRTVSRKPSSAPERRARIPTSIKPTQAAIREEEEEDMQEPQAGPSGTSHDAHPAPDPNPPQQAASVHNGQEILEIVNPLRAQVQDAQAELQRLSIRTADMDSLRSTIEDLKAEVAALRSQHSLATDLDVQVKALRQELAFLRSLQSSESSHSRSITGGSNNQSGSSGDSHRTVLPAGVDDSMMTQSSLGKRHRDTEDVNDMGGTIETGNEAKMSTIEAQRQAIRPKRKRAKLNQAPSTPSAGPSGETVPLTDAPMEGIDDGDDVPVIPPARPGPSFTVFSGPEEPPEPTADAQAVASSDAFAFPSSTPPNGATPGVPTSTANAAENQASSTGNNAFTFNFATSLFQPPTSTPHDALPHIPAPEPPTSPTPMYVERAGGRRERNDPFHPTGFPRTSRPPSGPSRPASRASQQPGGSNAGPSRQGEALVSPAVVRQTPPLPSVPEESRTSGEGRSETTNNNASNNSLNNNNATNAIMRSSALGSGAGTHTLPPSTSGTLILPAGIVPLAMAPDTPARPMKRTMYGTELEGDTRFGDFGVEGVATGFWSGAAPRF